MKEIGKKAYFFFDILFICLFLTVFIWTLVDYRMVSFYVSGIFVFLGFSLIYSKSLKDFSLIGKALYWTSQNVMVPRTRYNHIFGGLFFLLVAILSFLFPPGHEENETGKLLWSSLKKDPSFWISVIFALSFNLMVGLYMFKRKKKKRLEGD
jgi:hypothetical protein